MSLTRPSLVLQPEDVCLGTSVSHAEKSHPRLKVAIDGVKTRKAAALAVQQVNIAELQKARQSITISEPILSLK